jgi:hypothetical protein
MERREIRIGCESEFAARGEEVGPARAGHLEVGGLLPEGGGAPRRGVPSSEVDRLSGPVQGPSAALWPSRRCGRAYACGVRVHLPVSVQQGREGTCCTINEHRRHQERRELSQHVNRCNIIACAAYFLLHCGGRFFYAMRRR